MAAEETVVFMGGFLNMTDPFLHWQLYKWAWIAGLLSCAVFYAAWYYGSWKPYKPLWGLYYAYKAGSQAAFTCGLELYFELISEREAKCIFDYSKWDYDLPPSRFPLPSRVRHFLFNYATAFLDINPWDAIMQKLGHVNRDVDIAKKLQDDEWEQSPSVTIGGIRTDIILDADQWTVKGSRQHQAIEEAAFRWNEANPDDQVHSYSKFQRLMDEGRIAPPPEIRREVTVPWIRIDSAFPLELQDNEMAGYRRQAAEEMDKENQESLSKYYMPILIGGLGLAGIMFVFRVVTFYAH